MTNGFVEISKDDPTKEAKIVSANVTIKEIDMCLADFERFKYKKAFYEVKNGEYKKYQMITA